LISLIQNEIIKLVGKNRLVVVTMIIAILISMFTYAQFREAERQKERLGDVEWRVALQQRIIDWESRLNSNRISNEWRAELNIRVAQQQYYLDHDVNPAEPGAPTFVRGFIENSTQLFLPLMMMVIAADIVSSEHSAGTIKLLLTRPVKRWKIILSKYLTLVLYVSLIILIFSLLSYLISGTVFGFGGWTAPVLTGFAVEAGQLNTAGVQLLPQWQYILMELGLAWFVSLVVATLSFMLSVLVKSTAAGMGIMLASLISGTILSNMVASWESAKYLFMVNLGVINYLEGNAPPIEGMSLGFSLAVLAIWGGLALIASFTVFVRQDVY